MNSEAIGGVLSALLESSRKEAAEAFEGIKNIPRLESGLQAIEKRNPDHFRLHVLYPLGQALRGMIESSVGRSQEAIFLLSHADFVSNHIRHQIKLHEGSACCADKTRTIMRAALRYYVDKTPIVFNYEGEYTYHLPKVILKDQSSVFRFIKSLERLYYGQPSDYLDELRRIKSQADAAVNPES